MPTRREFLKKTSYGLVVASTGVMNINGQMWAPMPTITPEGAQKTMLTGTVYLYGRMAMDLPSKLATREQMGKWLDMEMAGLKADFVRNVMAKVEGRQSWGEGPPQPGQHLWLPDRSERFYDLNPLAAE